MLGYEAYVGAAGTALSRLLMRVIASATPLPPLTDAEFMQQHAFILSALELLLQPRSSALCLAGEAFLVETCRKVLSATALVNTWPCGCAQQLRDALQRVERSGAEQQRHMQSGLACARRDRLAECAAAVASAARHGLRHCALESCGAREAHASHYKLCSACTTVAYCGKAHQAEHWATHKAACKAARRLMLLPPPLLRRTAARAAPEASLHALTSCVLRVRLNNENTLAHNAHPLQPRNGRRCACKLHVHTACTMRQRHLSDARSGLE